MNILNGTGAFVGAGTLILGLQLVTNPVDATNTEYPLITTLEEAVSPPSEDPNIVRLAAFDLGGGSSRVLVADVDLKENKIIHKLFNAKLKIGFRAELVNSDKFSNKIQSAALERLLELKQKVSIYQPKFYAGVATEAFRLAQNGESFLHRLRETCQIDLQIIDQKLEGRIGLLSLQANNPEIDSEIICVDIGSGSLQISTLKAEDKTIEVFQAKLGRLALDEMFFKNIRNQTPQSTVNPITKIEAKRFKKLLIDQFETMSDYLKNKLASKDVKVISSLDPVYEKAIWKNKKAWRAIKLNIIDHTDDQLLFPKATTEAILVCAMLKGLNIERIYGENNSGNEGSCSGILLTPEFWPVAR